MPSVQAMSVNECPEPATRTVRPDSRARLTAAATSSSERGRSKTAGAHRCSPAQFVQISGTRPLTLTAHPRETGGMRDMLAIVLEPVHLRKTLKIALVVGCVLTAINQLDVFLKGDATTLTFVKTGLNFVVPFVVSNLGLLAGKRAEAE